MVAENKEIVHSVVTIDLKAWLRARAEAEGRSMSNFVAILLEKARENDPGQGKEKSTK